MTTNPYNTYKNQDLETSSSKELVGKLYNAAIVALRRSIIAVKENRIEGSNNDIVKAQNIICALDGCLDMNFAVSEQMHSLYAYMLQRLAQANIKKDTEILDEIAGLITELRDAWNEAMELGRISYKGASANA